MKASDLPLKIKIASPCPARWEDMGGDDRVRYCGQCQKNVYNLSAMTASEAQNLIIAKNGDLCGRVYQRADGTVLTNDCPVGMALYWRKAKTAVAGCVAAMLFIVTGVVALGRDRNDPAIAKKGPILEFVDDAVWKVKDWLGLNPVAKSGKTMMVTGIICPVLPKTNAPLTGKVAAAPKQPVPAPQPPKK